MLQTMAAPLERVFVGTREIHGRWPHCSWWKSKINFFGISLYTLLADLISVCCLSSVTIFCCL
jgi:hypothetical protein